MHTCWVVPAAVEPWDGVVQLLVAARPFLAECWPAAGDWVQARLPVLPLLLQVGLLVGQLLRRLVEPVAAPVSSSAELPTGP